MNPKEYETSCKKYFEELGYQVELTQHQNDYGVDLFLLGKNEKIAVQAKMYGGTSRKTNRKMIMELHGSKDYFDCDSAIFITNGELIEDATEVAHKLNIKIIYYDGSIVNPKLNSRIISFETIWEKYIMPLEGNTIFRDNGKSNKILKVDWGGIKRITSNGKEQFIDIEPFQFAIIRMLEGFNVTRDGINQSYTKRASSGIVLVLEQIPFIVIVLKRPKTLSFDLSKMD